MAYVLAKYIHLVGIMVLVSALVLEHALIKPKMSPAQMGKVAIVDLVYGVSAAMVLMAGLFLWFVAGKGSDFYASNPVFLAKVGVFAFVGLVSIYPTVFFIKNRRATSESVSIPKPIMMVVRFELLLIFLLPLLAVLMAQGHGHA